MLLFGRLSSVSRLTVCLVYGEAGLRRSAVGALGAFHTANPDLQGITAPGLRAAMQPRLGPAAFAAALVGLQAAGDLVVQGAWVRRPGHVARLPAGAQASPMTYVSDKTGRQYVVIAAGGHLAMRTRSGDYVLAFALPKTELGAGHAD